MDYKKLNNKLIITTSNGKKTLIKGISLLNEILNIKVITLDEFKKKYFFDYDKKTIHYICTKESCIYAVAKIYLENMYYIDETKEYTIEKLSFLKNLKLDLKNKGLIHENPLFKEYIKKRKYCFI